ncbi:MAG: hypothetical protein FWD57_03755 [Polyangiaceae bacterium]|nr:hypothetical protein [Polyangiaceae bacterium]
MGGVCGWWSLTGWDGGECREVAAAMRGVVVVSPRERWSDAVIGDLGIGGDSCVLGTR